MGAVLHLVHALDVFGRGDAQHGLEVGGRRGLVGDDLVRGYDDTSCSHAMCRIDDHVVAGPDLEVTRVVVEKLARLPKADADCSCHT